MTTLPSASTPTVTGELWSLPLDRRVISTAWWLAATNTRASSVVGISPGPRRGIGGWFADDHDFQGAGAVDALDPAQLDVGGGGGAGDEGDRAPLAGGAVEGGDRLGDRADDLGGLHHAQVVVGQQGDGAAALAGAAVPADRAGL